MGRRPHMGLRVDTVLKRGFRAGTCKDRLKDTVERIKQARKQKTDSAKQLRKAIAQLLQSGQDSNAYKLETENLVRIQKIMGAYDLIDRYCELVISRMKIISSQRNCPVDVKEAVASLIFAAPRCSDLKHLPHVRYMFEQKYGMEFTAAVEELRPDCGVNTQIIELLSTSPATGQTTLLIMREIAAENNIEWKGENEFTTAPRDLSASTMEWTQSRNIAPTNSRVGKVYAGIPVGDSIEVSHLTEYSPPLQTSEFETECVSDSESEIEFHDAVEGSVQDSESPESKMWFQDAPETAESVVALNGESSEGTRASHRHEDMPSSKSDEATCMPSQKFYEYGAYIGSGRRQYKNSASAAQASLPHEDNVSNVRPNQFPRSKMPSSKSDEVPRMPSQRFYEDGAYLRSDRRQYKDMASAAQAALPHEDNVPNAGTGTDSSPAPPEKPSLNLDEVTRMPSQKFYKDSAYRGSGSRSHYKDFASAAQVVFESAALAAETAQAAMVASAVQVVFESAALAAEAAREAMELANFFDSERRTVKYSSSSNSLSAKAAATEIPKARPEYNSKLFESNVYPHKVTGDPKDRPVIEREISDSNSVLNSFPSAVFNSAWKTGERSVGEISSSSDDDVGGMSNPTWDSEHVPQEKPLPAKSGSGCGDFKQKLLRKSEGSDDDAMINPGPLWKRSVAGARLAKRTEDTYVKMPKFDDEGDVPYAYGEHFRRNSLEKMNSGSGEFSGSSSLLTRTQRGSSEHSSFSVGTFEEDGGGEKLRFERSRLREDSPAARRGSEVFYHNPKFDEEVNDGLLASGMGQFARLSSGHDREKAEAAAAHSPVSSEAGRRSEAKLRWHSSSSNVAEDMQDEQKKRVGHGNSRRTRWAQNRPLVSPPEAEQHDKTTAASATSRKNFAEVDEFDTKSYYSRSSSTKVAANDAAVEAVGGGGSASAAAVSLPPPPSRQAFAAAVTLPPPTRSPPPAPTLQLTLSPSPLTPSLSDPVVLATSTPQRLRTCSSAASAPSPAARYSRRDSHTHPKLPDYEDFVARFEKLRQESNTAPPS